jgi:uncharacterized protein
VHPVQQTIVDFTRSTYLDKGGEAYQLTSCIRSNDGAYVAGPAHSQERVAAFQRWLLPEAGWMVGRPLMHPGIEPFRWDWYIDIVAIDVTEDVWRVSDRYIDVTVFENHRYELLDLDEIAEAMEAGSLSSAEGIAALRSTHHLRAELKELDFSVPSLLERHAPALPALQDWESVTTAR